MESRVQFEGKLHFFEHLSLQKFDEYLRNALYYSLDILTTQNVRFVKFRYYIKEIVSLIELALHLPFLLTKNGTFTEFFYSYERNKLSKARKTMSIILLILIPYFESKLKDKHQQYQQNKQKQMVVKFIDCLYYLWDFYLKALYLLGGEDYRYYSPYYKIMSITLNKVGSKEQTKFDRFTQYLPIGIFLGLKVMDFYFTNQSQPNFSKQKEVEAPKIVKKQKLCPICKDSIKNPAFLQTNGTVYCYRCIYQWVTEHASCPTTHQKVDTSLIFKLYVQL